MKNNKKIIWENFWDIWNEWKNFEWDKKKKLENWENFFSEEQKNFVNWAIEISWEISETKQKINKTEILKNWLRIENCRWNELLPEEIREMSDFYLEIFRNEPYNQFLLKKDDPLNPISPKKFFWDGKKYYSLEETELDELPDWYAYWMERNRVEEVTNMRMWPNTYVTRMFDEKAWKLVWLAYWRRATLQEIFETEEMKNPLFLSDYFDKELLADDEKFYGKMKYHCNLDKNDDVFYVSWMAIGKLNRGFDNFFNFIKLFWSQVSNEDLKLFFFAELESEWAAHDIDIAISWNELFWILENWHSIMVCETARKYADYFKWEKKKLFSQLKKYKKSQR